MPFEVTSDVDVRRDEEGTVRHLRHVREPYTAEEDAALRGGVPSTPRALADRYVRDVADLYELESGMLDTLAEEPVEEPVDEGVKLRFAESQAVKGTTTVSYEQTSFGLPVVDAGVTVRVQAGPLRVTSSDSSVHPGVDAERPPEDAPFLPDHLDVDALRERLGVGDEYGDLSVTEAREVVYRYDPDERIDPDARRATEEGGEARPLESPPPTLPLPPVPGEIEPGRHYVVTEVLFSMEMPEGASLNWRAYVEPETGAVLYLRALTTGWTGTVYEQDPVTVTGDHSISPGASGPVLDPLRTSSPLPGLSLPSDADVPQELRGEFVEVVDLAAPNVDAPARDRGSFRYHVRSDEFAAVCAYYLCDRGFRLLSELGFDVRTYFDGTRFPVSVDHRADGIYVGRGGSPVNASAPGNAGGDGSDGFRFGLAQLDEPTGMATAWRIVLHEFGHALLWDNVRSPNFGFAHSAGDSLAAILNDPRSSAADRFLTFPWIAAGTPGLDRRHDRDPGAGWTWGDRFDDRGYGSEQILSTILFRVYRALGGDDERPGVREFAARHAASLVVYAIGTLSPRNRAFHADEFATALVDADAADGFEGVPGGGVGKVVDWGFASQEPGGPSPAVDVYVDDGRDGGYEYQRRFWECRDVWSRRSPDGVTVHEPPIVDRTNYAYVRVKNRGSQRARNVAVRGFHSRPGVGGAWPGDWRPADDGRVDVGSVHAGSQVVVGPVRWTPTTAGGTNLLFVVEADGDRSNVGLLGPTPVHHLVRFDNNVGLRSTATVPATAAGLEQAFQGRQFGMRNPFDHPVEATLESTLPGPLAERGWSLSFPSEADTSLELGPLESRAVDVRLDAGSPVPSGALSGLDGPLGIGVELLADGLCVGGITYEIDPGRESPARERPLVPAGRDVIARYGARTPPWLRDWLRRLERRLESGR